MHPSPRVRTRTGALLALAALVAAFPAVAASKSGAKSPAAYGRNYDLRLTLETGAAPALAPAQAAAVAELRREVPTLKVDVDHLTGAARTINAQIGLIAGPRAGDAESITVGFAQDNLALLGLSADDLADYEVTDSVYSKQSGVTHIYLRQRHDGIPVYNGQLHGNVAADGSLVSLNNLFVPNLAGALNATSPAIDGDAAVGSYAGHLGSADFDASKPELMILATRPGEARLVWNFRAENAQGRFWHDVNVDAADGRVWTIIDWIADDSYRVYNQPVEHPGFAAPAPPADGRTTQVNPHLDGGTGATGASPFGWHDTNGVAGAESTLTLGNNVDAYTDTDANNTPDVGSRPDGTATLTFTPAIDLTQAPAANRPPAVVNLFYWNNIIHDIEYQYGFDEVGGNFQVNNYGRGGLGADSVQAEAQDGSGTCNANFGTPVDGARPRMQMFISAASCFAGAPARDGDFDNMVIVHEYGHGISNRLVGGPGNVSCLGNGEQPGEGLSDWWGLSLTAIASQTGTTSRGVGTWLFGDFPNGIRTFPYSTNNAVNPDTYQTSNTRVAPHGVGSVWAQIYWEVYWALVTEHGFDQDFYNVLGTGADAGNIRAKAYIVEGLKNAVCSPGFVNVRDGILAGAATMYGGEDVCLLWGAFAAIGLGENAVQGTNGNGDQVDGFNIPTTCSFGNAGNDARVCRTAGSHVQSILVGPAFTSPPVDMSVAGNPSPSTAVFSEDPVSGPLPETITLTIGNLATVAAGTYDINVTGDDGVNVNVSDFDLTVDAAAPAATTLTAPANSTSGHPTQPTFTWAALATAQSYVLEVDNNSDFSSITYTASPTTNSHVPTSALPANTLLYWRVRAVNTCGTGVNSAVFNFTASSPVQFCNTTPLAIPDSPAPAVSSNLVIPSGGAITDLDISLTATHTWVGDVQFTLSNGGAPVSFYDRPGRTTTGFGCSGDNIDVIVNDEGPDGNVESQCANLPATSGDRVGGDPASSTLLAAFDGQPLADTWTLTAQDFAGGDTGTVTEWCLQTADTMPFIDGFEPGTTVRWSSTVN